ncbi:MAG: IS1182 family transposase [archaeon]
MAYVQSFRNQNYLLPPNITDLFSQNHVCYLLEQITDELNYSSFDEQFAGAGHPAYHPRILLKLLLMGYVDGLRSSRRIAKNAHENVVYIYLAEKTSPDFRTISDFRKNNTSLVKEVFKQLNLFALKHGLVDLSQLMIDGTVIKACANDEKVIDKATIDKLQKYIDQVIEEGIRTDEEEDALLGNRGLHEMPKDLSDSEKRRPIVRKIVKEINTAIQQGKPEKTQAIKAALEHAKQSMHDKQLTKFSFTDADSRFMISKKGRFELGYNAQLVTDKTGMIISGEVIAKSVDRGQLRFNIRCVEDTFGALPAGTKISADKGYQNGEEMAALEQHGFDLYIPVTCSDQKETDHLNFGRADFTYDEQQDVYVCPMNIPLRNRGTYLDGQSHQHRTTYISRVRDCKHCVHFAACCKDQRRKKISVGEHDKLFNRMRTKLRTTQGRAVYDLRKQTVERSIGDIKHNRQFTHFLLRTHKNVATEFSLACISHNIVLINNRLRRAA